MRDSQINPYEHSEIKVKLLELYLEKYVSIISNSRGIKELKIYDLFCGEGVYENGKEGSPVIILKIIKNIFYRNKSKSNSVITYNCHFNDLNKNKTDKLSKHITDKKLHYSEIGSIEYLNKDYHLVKKDVISQKGDHEKKKFIFIDPYGYKEISLKDIEEILSDNHTEVLLFLPTQFMYRFETESTPDSLYLFLKEALSEEELNRVSSDGVDFIHKLRDGFGKKLKGKHYVDSFIITREKNQYFALFFFTSHLYGFEKFLEAKWGIDEEEGRGWNSTYGKDLFSVVESTPNTDKFEENLIEYLSQRKSNIEIHRFTIENRHLIKHSNQILKNLQDTNRLDVVLADNTNARKGSFYIGWNEVKTKINKCYIKTK